jgi:hypothetical protein
MAWVLRNERSGGWWHPRAPQGTTLNHIELAYRFDYRDEAEQAAAGLNDRDRRPEYGELGHDDWIVVEN